MFQIERPGESSTDDSDPRPWTSQHIKAANVLTPPTGDELDSNDVDVRGPDGFTPLMLASIRGTGGHDIGLDNESSTTSSGDGDESDGSPEIIRSLLMQGAAINAQTDRTGQFIHLMFINIKPL